MTVINHPRQLPLSGRAAPAPVSQAHPLTAAQGAASMVYPEWICKVGTMKSTLFKSNQSQAVRLPKAVAFPSDVKKVDVIAIGRTRVLIPEGETWASWFEGPRVSDDFMEDRDQPAQQEREPF